MDFMLMSVVFVEDLLRRSLFISDIHKHQSIHPSLRIEPIVCFCVWTSIYYADIDMYEAMAIAQFTFKSITTNRLKQKSNGMTNAEAKRNSRSEQRKTLKNKWPNVVDVIFEREEIVCAECGWWLMEKNVSGIVWIATRLRMDGMTTGSANGKNSNVFRGERKWILPLFVFARFRRRKLLVAAVN